MYPQNYQDQKKQKSEGSKDKFQGLLIPKNPASLRAKQREPHQRSVQLSSWISDLPVLLKNSILKHTGLFDEKLPVCEDYDLWLRITAHNPVIFLDEPLINKYGGHEDQLSRVPAGIEQYRIQSLEKILHTVELRPAQSDAARMMLLRKMNIYLGGLKKRGRSELVKKIEEKIAYWTII